MENKTEKIAILCSSEQMMQRVADAVEAKTKNGHDFVSGVWNRHRRNTCMNIIEESDRLGFSSEMYYLKNGYQIIEDKTFLKNPEKWIEKMIPKEEVEFKVGDVYIDEYKTPYAYVGSKKVLDDKKGDFVTMYIFNYGKSEETIEKVSNFRKATEEEAKKFHEFLKSKNLMWDAEKKEVVKWRAEKGENYYYIDGKLNIKEEPDGGALFDNDLISVSNYFATKEMAEEVAKEIKELLKNKTF